MFYFVVLTGLKREYKRILALGILIKARAGQVYRVCTIYRYILYNRYVIMKQYS